MKPFALRKLYAAQLKSKTLKADESERKREKMNAFAWTRWNCFTKKGKESYSSHGGNIPMRSILKPIFYQNWTLAFRSPDSSFSHVHKWFAQMKTAAFFMLLSVFQSRYESCMAMQSIISIGLLTPQNPTESYKFIIFSRSSFFLFAVWVFVYDFASEFPVFGEQC